MENKKQQVCKVRPDILNQNLAVPIGNEYYSGHDPLSYRWVEDEFQVFYNENWQIADSVDFAF